MSDVVKRDLYGLIDKELEAANQKFPLFNSTHEAFAVILEEAEEAKEEAGNLDILMNNFWIGVKENHDPEALHEELTGIYKKVYVDGLAGSIASILAFAGSEPPEIPSNAFLMIHNPFESLVNTEGFKTTEEYYIQVDMFESLVNTEEFKTRNE